LLEGAQPKLLADGFVFVEGPVWSDQLGALLFSEMDFGGDGSNGPPSKIHLVTEGGQPLVFLANGGSNGLAIDETGLLACTHDTQAVSRIDLTTKERTLLAPHVNGKHFNSPNDLVPSSTGHIYFTDPDWQLGSRKNETGITGVYWRSPDGKVTLVEGTLPKPNGIHLSPDEKTLYVGANDGKVYRYSIDATGRPQGKRQFASVDGPDGFTVDCAGNLYVASHGAGKVEVFGPKGEKLHSISVAPKTTNLAFGGSDRKTLYVTAGSGVYSLRGQIPGYPY
jgi:gluconolactonase